MNKTPPRWCPNCGTATRTAERLSGVKPQSLICRGCGWLWTPTCRACGWPATPSGLTSGDPEGYCGNPVCTVAD